MPTVPVRLVLFLSSYAPLLIILAIREWPRSQFIAGSLAALAGLSTLVLFLLFVKLVPRLHPVLTPIARASSRSAEAVAYIVTYLIPFLDLRLDAATDIASLVILMGAIGIIYVNSNMILVNPLLSISGYHLYDAETGEGTAITVLSRRRFIGRGSELELRSLGAGVFVEART